MLGERIGVLFLLSLIARTADCLKIGNLQKPKQSVNFCSGMAGRPKGTPKTGGRLPGTVNKVNREAREAFQWAFNKLGGAQALAEWGSTNKNDFYRLYGRLIPVDTTSGGDKLNFPASITVNLVNP